MGTLFNVLLYEGILLILISGDIQLWSCSSEPFSVQTFIDSIAVRLHNCSLLGQSVLPCFYPAGYILTVCLCSFC